MAEKELWKKVPGYKNYEVSDQGRVRSLDRLMRHQSGTEYIRRGRMLRLLNGPQGYTTVHFGQKMMNKYVHHLVMKAFVGNVPKGKEILHNNGNKKDNRLMNLRFGTRWENMQDLLRHRYEQAWLEYAENTKKRRRLGNGGRR